jgi:hypothetical protein
LKEKSACKEEEKNDDGKVRGMRTTPASFTDHVAEKIET